MMPSGGSRKQLPLRRIGENFVQGSHALACSGLCSTLKWRALAVHSCEEE